MSGATFSRAHVWNAGDNLTASDLNGEFNNLLTNLNPAGIYGQADTLSAMRAVANPYSGGAPSQATSLMAELQQIRYMITQITGQTYWYLPGGPGTPIDNSSAGADIPLGVGQKAYIAATGETSIPLYISCGDGQQYEITMTGSSTAAAAGAMSQLQPNNTTYSAAFTYNLIAEEQSTPSASAGTTSMAYLEGLGASPDSAIIRAWTSTVAKRLQSQATSKTTTSNYAGFLTMNWNDITTVWSSLGTIVMPVAWTGTVTIERKF